MKKKVLSLLLAAAFVSGMAGCAAEKNTEEEESPRKYISVGFSQLGAESDWRVANTDSIRESLSREEGFDLMFDDAQQKQDKQIRAIRNFTQQEVDCIVLAPVMETGWDTVLEEARDAGIPVVVVDRMVDVKDKTLFTAWVGSDFKKEGKVACEWLNEYTKAKGISPEELNIVDIQGTLGATAQIGRTDGLMEGAEKYGWNIVASEPADYTRAKGREVMQKLLNEYENINVAYCENDNEAMGVIDAIEASGRVAGTDIANGEILVISFDAAHSGLSMVMEGKIALDVECNPLQGDAVKNLINAIKNGEDFEKYTYIKESAFSSDDTVTTVMIDDEIYDITTITPEILREREY
ncbi:MAG: ABC transporter substrate-binding protein [Eubacterium sp.]|nr:ABC transporter substrate-binding protein [Eubacterium sp.]